MVLLILHDFGEKNLKFPFVVKQALLFLFQQYFEVSYPSLFLSSSNLLVSHLNAFAGVVPGAQIMFPVIAKVEGYL